MKWIAATIPAVAAAAFFVGIRAETPWLGPKTNDIFSVAASRITLAAGQSLVIATVPSDKRLVVTAAAIDDFGGYATNVEVDEVDATGTSVVKLPAGLVYRAAAGGYPCNNEAGATGHGDGLGALFGPGTNVVIKNTDPGTGTSPLSYFVAGYLAPK